MIKEILIYWFLIFLLISIMYYIFLKRKYNVYVGKKKNKREAKKLLLDTMELSYLISRFSLDVKKMNLLMCIRYIALINGIIIATTTTLVYYLPFTKIFWQLAVGFVLLLGLIYSLYEIFGRLLVKRGWKKK